LVEGQLTRSEMENMKELYDTKYSSSAWNLER